MADKEFPAALQAAQDVPVEENEQVKALVVLLMGKDPAGGRELEELAGQVASMERRLDAALDELGDIRQKIQEVQDRSLKAVLQKNCKMLEGNVDAMRQRILELKGQVIEGCRNILKDFADRGAVALDGVSRFLRLRPALEAVQAAAEKTVQSSDRAASRIDAFSTEFHEAGRHLKNMGRTIQGRPAQAEAKDNGRVADAFKDRARFCVCHQRERGAFPECPCKAGAAGGAPPLRPGCHAGTGGKAGAGKGAAGTFP